MNLEVVGQPDTGLGNYFIQRNLAINLKPWLMKNGLRLVLAETS
jgi:hypothetical protein